MKAAILEGPGVLTLRDIPMRTCSQDEVLVKVAACGICGSDLRYFRGENPWAQHTLGRNDPNPPNMILGHEFAGTVVEAGNPDLAHLVGKRVAIEPYNTCGMCEFCRTGRYNLCRRTRHIGHAAGWSEMDFFPGGMAEYCQVWGTHVYELPDGIPFDHAAILDPLAVAIHAVAVSNFAPGADVLVMGAGPVGLCLSQVVKAFGASRVFTTDVYARALEVAMATGVDHGIDVRTTDLVPYVMDHTGGRGVDVAFDTAGSTETQRQSLRLLAASGMLVNLVAGSTRIDLELMELSAERCIKGSSNNLYEDFLLAIELVASGRVNPAPLITHTVPLQEVNRGFDLFFDKERTGAVKVVVTMQ